VDADAERRLHQRRQGACLLRSAGAQVLLDEAHDLVGELVGRLRATRAGQQAGEAVALEGGLSLVVGGARHAEQRSRLGLVDAVLAGVAKHLVLHLHEVVGIEEARAMEPRGADGFGPRVEHAKLAQPIALGLLGHRNPSSRCVNIIMPHS
jgi:hypothetical protein